MRKRLISLFLVLVLLALAACGGKSAETSSDNTAQVDESNPVLNVAGVYYAGRASVQVDAVGADSAKFTVLWGSSAWEDSEWIMSGKLDPDTMSVVYADCVRTDRVFGEDGTVSSETVAYENGSGRVVFNAGEYSLTWQDDVEHIANGMIFLGRAAAEETSGSGTDPIHYTPVTAMPVAEVESLAATVRKAYLEQNWTALAVLIRYPITVDGTELKGVDAFLRFMQEATVGEEDLAAMRDESCRNMFVNSGGIMMGQGQVWLADSSFSTENDPVLQVIILKGITGGEDYSETPAPSTAPDPNLPRVTKSPTDEDVDAGGTCWFNAKYENAKWAVWHFVSPDGEMDIPYNEINTKFPDLVVVQGYSSTTQLKNIPKGMDGWRVYCRFTNNSGGVNTEMATIHINGASGENTAPTVTTDRDGYYRGVTAMKKAQVEEFAASVRKYYLEEDWEKLSGLIRYPITVLGTELKDADDFVAFMVDKTIAEADAESMKAESCVDMAFNGQGICLGRGQVWILDLNFMTDRDPVLRVFALSGIVKK